MPFVIRPISDETNKIAYLICQLPINRRPDYQRPANHQKETELGENDDGRDVAASIQDTVRHLTSNSRKCSAKSVSTSGSWGHGAEAAVPSSADSRTI
ncbi:hypothetical protein T10_3686 [Trichinella papuae]|uniref:Uncharacterized protein n=1 Tax=Trichinella papuae TaxID=268474 RepID=A0A0V1MF18_9BILA|nr:hypothetical protein T10_3686 [Trichinella papuae]